MFLGAFMNFKGYTWFEIPCTTYTIVLTWPRLMLIYFHVLEFDRFLQVLIDLIVISSVMLGFDGTVKSFVPAFHAFSSLCSCHCWNVWILSYNEQCIHSQSKGDNFSTSQSNDSFNPFPVTAEHLNIAQSRSLILASPKI